MVTDGSCIFTALVSLGCSKLVALYLIHRTRPRSAVKVGVVSTIYLYPIKSCRPIELDEALCTYEGWKHTTIETWDRHFVVVDDTGSFQHARQHPTMTTIQPSLSGDKMHLDAPGMETLIIPAQPRRSCIINTKIWGEAAIGYDCGDEASDWFSTFLGVQNFRLLYAAPELRKRKRTLTLDPKYRLKARPQDQVAYHDYGAYMLASEASLKDICQRSKMTLDMKQFRPTIVVSGFDEPWHEDSFLDVYIGNAKLTNLKPCTRCSMTTVDPETGIKNPDNEPLKTMLSYRCAPPEFPTEAVFGINLFADLEGTVKVGDDVFVTYK